MFLPKMLGLLMIKQNFKRNANPSLRIDEANQIIKSKFKFKFQTINHKL